MKYLWICIFATFILAGACNWENYYQRELPGDWHAVSWTTEDGSPFVEPERVRFSFDADSSYTAVLGARNEKGIWWVDGYKLYTIAEDAQRNLVRVIKLENDTVHFEMNRGGQKELLILARTK